MPGNPDELERFLKSFREGGAVPVTRRAFLQGSSAALAAAAQSAAESSLIGALTNPTSSLSDDIAAVDQKTYLPHYSEDEQVLYQLVAPVSAGKDPFNHSPLVLDGMRLVMTRATDFLHASFTFANVSLLLHFGKPYLLRTDDGKPALVTIHLPPQHQQEEAFIEDSSGATPTGDTLPTMPVELTLSGETTFTYPLSLPAHKRIPLMLDGLLCWTSAPTATDTSSAIELPYRTVIQSVEASSVYQSSTLPDKDDADTPPQLWHLTLEAQAVTAISVVRAKGIITLTLPSVTGWTQYQTIGILQPAMLAGDFVISSVSSSGSTATITFPQLGTDIKLGNTPLSLANRFVATRALDFLPAVISVASSGNTVTLTFSSVPAVRSAALIYVAPEQNDPGTAGTYVVTAVSGNSLSYDLPSGTAPKACTVSLVRYVPYTADGTVNIITTQATALHPAEGVLLFNSVDQTTTAATVATPDIPSSGNFKTTLTFTGNNKLPAAGMLVLQKTYPVDQQDRHDLVVRSVPDKDPTHDVPMAVDQLVFSALGAWFSTQASFKPASLTGCFATPPPSMEKYIYRMAQGRDYYVEIDRTGYLLPYGHEAAWLKITRRVFYRVEVDVTPAENVCFLRQQFFIVPRQKTRMLRMAQNHGNEMPFTQVDILTPVTPALFAGDGSSCDALGGENGYFWPSYKTDRLFNFDLRAYDGADPRTAIPFSQPLMFVSTNIACMTPNVVGYYNNSAYTVPGAGGAPATNSPRPTWRQADFSGQSFHFAQSVRKGDTQLHAGPMSFKVAALQATDSTDVVNFQGTYVLPNEPLVMYRSQLDWAAVDIPAMRVFTGNSASVNDLPNPAGGTCQTTDHLPCLPAPIPFPSGYVKVDFDPLYLQQGFTISNPVEVFLRVDNTDIAPNSGGPPSHAALTFPGQQGGGAATPTSPVGGLSRSHGITNQNTPSSTPSSTYVTANVGFDPTVDFQPLNIDGFLQAKLLGCISLSDVVAQIGDVTSALNNIPSLNLSNIYGLANEAISEISTIQKSISTAIKQLKTATDTIDSNLQSATDTLCDAIEGFVLNLAPLDPPTAALLVAPAVANCGSVTSLPTLYGMVSNTLQSSMTAIATDVANEIKNNGVTELAGEDYNLLRVAGDIDLMSDLWPSIYQTYGAGLAGRAIFTLDDVKSKLQKDIYHAAVKALSRERRPLDQLLAQLKKFLDALNTVATGTINANTISGVRTQASALISTFVRTFKQLGVELSTPTLSQYCYKTYYQTLLPTVQNGARAETGLWTQLKSSLNGVQTDIQNVVAVHHAAFKNVISAWRTQHHLNLPSTLTADYDQVMTCGVNLATLFVYDPIEAAIDAAQPAFIAGASIVGGVLDGLNSALSTIAGIEQQFENVIDLLETPIAVTGSYTLADIPLQDGPAGNAIFLAHNAGAKAHLRVDATVSASATPLSPSSATLDYLVKAGIYDFSLNLLPAASFITVAFDEFSYTASRSAGTHFNCKLASVDSVLLDDVLGFVAGLVAAFGPLGGADDDDDDDGDDDGDDGSGGGPGLVPIIHLAGFGLSVGFELKVPPIEAGGFQLINIGFSIALAISFGNDPLKLQFYFARPDAHFLMSATIWGGGGFLGLELRPNGVDRVQGAMEFGACAGVDLGGVAEGEVHIFGGIYFDFGDQRAILTGYVRAGGSLRIIKIITVSLEFYLGLTYENDGGQSSVYGDCTLTVSISILFFHADVSVHMHWQWAGSSTGSTQHMAARPEVANGANNKALSNPATCSAVNPRTAQWTQDFWSKYTAAFR
ncbi:hypothetical protein [Granulicella sp. L60]|uniref:hypothetical protein n=1 Tax=Granulicella sp. L60 TaxID=1641866 RepID=UPI00131C9D82|nr:hypothetical protein [Granulicella sp. L60]